MCWLSEALARAGFLAVAVDHHGNNAIDGYTPEGFVRWWERARDLAFVLDALSASEGLGAIGAAGFSLGGYTVGALLGARVSGDRFQALLRGEIPGPPPPEYPNLPAELRDRLSPSDVPVWAAEAGADYADARVRAGFLICPAIGEMLESDSLAAISTPVAVRWVEQDEIVSKAQSVEPYVRNIPRVSARNLSGGIGHYAFLADNPDFAQLRAQVAAEACAFFDKHLAASPLSAERDFPDWSAPAANPSAVAVGSCDRFWQHDAHADRHQRWYAARRRRWGRDEAIPSNGRLGACWPPSCSSLTTPRILGCHICCVPRVMEVVTTTTGGTAMLEKVFYTSVLVSDQDDALDFYTNVLGLEKRVENPTPDGPRFLTVGVKGDDFQLVLWPGTPGRAEPAMGRPPASITIETDDCRKTVEELQSRGVEFVSDVLEFPWGYVAQFQDPDGNRLQVRGAASSSERRRLGASVAPGAAEVEHLS